MAEASYPITRVWLSRAAPRARLVSCEDRAASVAVGVGCPLRGFAGTLEKDGAVDRVADDPCRSAISCLLGYLFRRG
jgi:hypothetical protein